jgi:hypothetical protein
MNNETLVTLSSSDLDTVSGGGTLLSPGNVKNVLTVLGHDQASVMGVVKKFNLSPGDTFANGAFKGAQSSFQVLQSIRPW